MSPRLSDLVKQTVRDLRKEQTESEAILWQALRNRKLDDKKFVRQFPIVFEWEGRERFVVADFYCHEARLVIELDGGIHLKQLDYDMFRDEVLREREVEVLRFKNEQIKNNLPEILGIIKDKVNSSQSLLLKREGCGNMAATLSPLSNKRGGQASLLRGVS